MEEVKKETEAWKEGSAEEALRVAPTIGDPLLIKSNKGLNVSYEVQLERVGKVLFKPKSGEAACRKSITAGTFHLREAAAFRLDCVFGFRLVPVTVVREIQGEVGSAQAWVLVDGWITGYLKVDRARMAAFDYIIGNTDRHFLNWRTDDSGRPSASDNGLCLPRDSSEPMKSAFVTEHLRKELPSPVKDEVRRLTAGRATAILNELGIEQAAIEGLVRRLDEIQTNGTILGAAWGGPIKPF